VPRLETQRLVLRPARATDVDLVLRRALNPEFGRFLPLPEPYARDHAKAFVADMLARDPQTHPSFIVTLRGEAIGDVSLRVDADAAVGEMGWGMDPAHWGRGYTTEAAEAVMRWGFAERGLARVMARCDAENVASWRVMEKLGMRREGHLRAQRLLRGQRRDELVYGILREEVPLA
jgi:RimJ/RimL family protein N-acetyltransferase